MTANTAIRISSVTPHLVVSNARAAIAFYKQVFGAVCHFMLTTPDTVKVIHASVSLGEASVMLCDEFGHGQGTNPALLGDSSVAIALDVDDVDGLVQIAEKAGATIVYPPEDTFWGARYAKFRDPFGHLWEVMKQVREVTPEEMQAAVSRMFS